MMAPSDHEIHLRCSIEQKLHGRAQESRDDGERWESELLGLTYISGAFTWCDQPRISRAQLFI